MRMDGGDRGEGGEGRGGGWRREEQRGGPTNNINNAIDWDTIVAIPIPVMPIGGIKRKPKINIGFKIIFRKKLKINIFL